MPWSFGRRSPRKEEVAVATSVKSAYVKALGLEPVMDWPDVMKLKGDEREAAVAVASKALWNYMAVLARDGMAKHDRAFREARMNMTPGGQVSWSTDGTGYEGWRWDGVITDAYIALWLSLQGRIDGPRESEDAPTKMAKSFRIYTSQYLKGSHNMACVVYNGGMGSGGGSGGRVVPQWFIAKEWNPDPPIRIVRLKEPTEPSALDKAAKRLTPEQAGETRPAQPVSTVYLCREGCTPPRRFTSAVTRDAHEAKEHAAIRCRAGKCGLVFTSTGSRRYHERSVHPQIYREYYPWPCPAPMCKDERFETVRGFGMHITASHPTLTETARSEAIARMRNGTSFEGFEWAPGKPASRASATATATAVKPQAAAPRLPEPTPERKPFTVATPAVQDHEETTTEVAVGYLKDLIADLESAPARLAEKDAALARKDKELAELKAELAKVQRDAALVSTLKALLANGGS
jgi:hypothetical protein